MEEPAMAVTVYSTPQCTFCKQVKKYFKEKRVPFRDYDVSRDDRKADEMYRKSGQMGVPVLDVHGKVLVGFDIEKIEKALRR